MWDGLPEKPTVPKLEGAGIDEMEVFNLPGQPMPTADELAQRGTSQLRRGGPRVTGEELDELGLTKGPGLRRGGPSVTAKELDRLGFTEEPRLRRGGSRVTSEKLDRLGFREEPRLQRGGSRVTSEKLDRLGFRGEGDEEGLRGAGEVTTEQTAAANLDWEMKNLDRRRCCIQ